MPYVSKTAHQTRKVLEGEDARERLLAELQAYKGSVPTLAAARGVGRNTVYRWLQRFGLSEAVPERPTQGRPRRA